jgi:hypothetical protein
VSDENDAIELPESTSTSSGTAAAECGSVDWLQQLAVDREQAAVYDDALSDDVHVFDGGVVCLVESSFDGRRQ